MSIRSFVVGVVMFACGLSGVAHAETVSAPSGGGVVTAGPKSKTSSSTLWNFVATDSPAWITDIVLKSSGGGLTLNTQLKMDGEATGGATINAASNYSLEFTVTANTTGSDRSWTMTAKDTSSSASVWSVTVSQPSGGSASPTGVAFYSVSVLNNNGYAWQKSFFLSRRDAAKTDWDPASSFESGYSPYIRFGYHNVGSTSIAHPKIAITLENRSTGLLLGSQTYTRDDVMSVGQGSLASDWEWDLLAELGGGSYRLTCTLDPDEVLNDSNRSDNVATFDFTVGSGSSDDDDDDDDNESLTFGPGKKSTFEKDGAMAVVLGVAGLDDACFSKTDSYGADCFIDSRVVDAEKANGDDDDNWWCGPITDMNLLYLSGWAKTAGLTAKYATVDDLLDYFRKNPKLLRYATTPGDVYTVKEGTYGYDGLFSWFKKTTGKDVTTSTYMKTGKIAKTFPKTLKTLMANGDYMLHLDLFFAEGSPNPRWGEMNVTHAVTCVGYLLDPTMDESDPNALVGLYIIDSDNDQYIAGDGRSAPNSIVFCPTYWCDDLQAFEVSGLWGWTSELAVGMSYKALKVQKPATATVKFDGNGADDYESETRTYDVGETYGELPEVSRSGYTFRGWYTKKTEGTKITETTSVAKGQTVVYALWDKIVTRKLTMKNGWAYDDEYNAKTSLSLYPGDSATVGFNTALIDVPGQTVGEFQRWTYSPADADLGPDFDPLSMETTVRMPNAAVTLTAQYVAVVAGRVAVYLESEGEVDVPYLLRWSLDKGGNGWMDDGAEVSLAAGTYTVSFMAADPETGAALSDFKVPSAVTITVPKRASHKEDGETVYDDPVYISYSASFIAAKDAVSVTFDPNGGKVSVKTQWVRNGGVWRALPVPADRKGYAFDGWFTAKSGGTRIVEGDDIVLGSAKTTLYAHWLKAYKLTVKGGGVSTADDDSEEKTTRTVLEGSVVTLIADEYKEGSKGASLAFSRWAFDKSCNPGVGFSATSSEATMTMPAVDVTVTATYVDEETAGMLLMDVAVANTYAGEAVPVSPDGESFQWSIDGKTWFKSREEVWLKAGTYTVQWRSLSSSWKAPASKKMTVVAGEETVGQSGAFEYIPVAAVTAVVYKDGAWIACTDGGTASMKPADGRLLPGKEITFTAKAEKKYAFVGWALCADGMAVSGNGMPEQYASRTATYKAKSLALGSICLEDSKVHYLAVFRPASDYVDEAMDGIFGDEIVGIGTTRSIDYDDETGMAFASLRMVVGCAAEVSVIGATGLETYPLTYTTSGKLPKGVSFDAVKGVLSGTPTAKGSFSYKVTAKDPAGHSRTLKLDIAVSALPSGIAGNFRSLLLDGESGQTAGYLELSVTSAGKASAKLYTLEGTKSLVPVLYWNDPGDDESFGSFVLEYVKYGYVESQDDEMSSNELYVIESLAVAPELDEAGRLSLGTVLYTKAQSSSEQLLKGDLRAVDAAAYKDSEFKTAFLGKYYTAVLYASPNGSPGYRSAGELAACGYLTMTTDTKGNAKIAGKLPDGKAVTFSGPVLATSSRESAHVILFAQPKDYKSEGGLILGLELSSDGGLSSVGDDTWIVPALFKAPAAEYDCLDRDDGALRGGLLLQASGCVYSKLTDLTDYYLNLSVSPAGSLLQEYSYTDSDRTKVYDRATAESGFDYLGSLSLVGGKTGKITVKTSGKPWKTSDGYYEYTETKAGDEIVNPAGLTLDFKPATGIFSGKFNLFFDYETSQMNHKAVSVSYAGVVVNNGDSPYAHGSAAYTGTYTLQYEDAKGKTKTTTYKKTTALTVDFTF